MEQEEGGVVSRYLCEDGRQGCCCAHVSPNYRCVLVGCDCSVKGPEKQCRCGEEQSEFQWVWDPDSTDTLIHFHDDKRGVVFHTPVSSGTSAVRGTEVFFDGQYHWEVKMTTPVYGTDMMVGVCTPQMALDYHKHSYVSLLGRDEMSWGLSYRGTIHHGGMSQRYMPNTLIREGTIIGVHLDTWQGTLSFYLNGQPLGVAFEGLRGMELYPAITSTSARSGMKLISASYFPSSLVFSCLKVLRRHVHHSQHVLDVVGVPGGLANYIRGQLDWLLRPHSLPERRHRPMNQASVAQQCRCAYKMCTRCLSACPPLHLSLSSPSLAHSSLGGNHGDDACSCRTGAAADLGGTGDDAVATGASCSSAKERSYRSGSCYVGCKRVKIGRSSSEEGGSEQTSKDSEKSRWFTSDFSSDDRQTVLPSIHKTRWKDLSPEDSIV